VKRVVDATEESVRGEHPTLDGAGMLGVLLVSLGTLMTEILLTRVFSVTMWYHFAFVAVSLAMLGLSAGAMFVYLMPSAFSATRTRSAMALFSLVLALAIVASIWIHVSLQFSADQLATFRAISLVLMLVPFTASGIVICLALTRFPDQVGRIYAFDLAGAALGCAGVVLLLDAIGDVFTAIVLVCALVALGAVLFSHRHVPSWLRYSAWSIALALLVLAGVIGARFEQGRPLIEVAWAKGQAEAPALLERWNSYSRIRVSGNMNSLGVGLKIDATAATLMRRFNGDRRSFAARSPFSKELPPFVHEFRPDSSVAIIGTGGGQDMLTAYLMGQPRVTGIEMNSAIVDALRYDFGEYTGHLDQLPGYELVNDEARSYLSRSDRRFDIIMATFIDTWAATAAGAFALSENSLYTVEAWETFLDRLTRGGVLSFTRWYRGHHPGEIYRLVSIAAEALRRRGVTDPTSHMAVLKKGPYGNLLVSNLPLSDADLDLLERLGREREFAVRFSPRGTKDPVFSAIASNDFDSEVVSRLPLDLSPSTDDRPFFFNMMPLQLFAGSGKPSIFPADRANWEAVSVLVRLVMVIGGLVLLVVFVPLAFSLRRVRFGGSWSYLLFFAAIGTAFMLIEVSQLQRLAIFLGHPTYSLSVVLFSLLVASAAGSFTTSRIADDAIGRSAPPLLLAMLVTLGVIGFVMPSLLQLMRGAAMPGRIAASVAMMLPMGFFMGMAFPIGMRLAGSERSALTPWFWGVNGATSVLASVVAVAIALGAGISVAYWVGVAGYAVALVAVWSMSKAAAPI
jgi:hypothetical protein